VDRIGSTCYNTGLASLIFNWQKWQFITPKTHLWLIKVWFSASTFVVKIATFAKPQNVSGHSMKTIVTILILTFSSYFSFGQKYSLTIDSLTKIYIDKLSKEKQIKFDSIVKQRLSVDIFKRIDSTTFDYAFIEESFCYSDTSGQVTERYFLGKDTIPKSVYNDGIFSDPKKIYDGLLIWYSKNVTYNYTLYPLIDKYSKFKPTQELAYDKLQIWSHGCVVYENSMTNFEKRRTEELKATYQIMTMIDKTNNKIIVSVQFAPTRPKFKTYSYNGVWDW
jgi:hypothetical protein